MPNDFTNSLLPEFTRAPEPVCRQSTTSLPLAPTQPPLPAEAAGAKNDDGKPDWSLLPLPSAEEVVAVLTFGESKYSHEHWRTVPPSDHFSAVMRHLVADRRGEKADHETGRPHLAHAVARLLFMMELQK